MEMIMRQSFEQLLRYDALTFVRQSHLELHGTPLDNDKYLELLALTLKTSSWVAPGTTSATSPQASPKHLRSLWRCRLGF